MNFTQICVLKEENVHEKFYISKLHTRATLKESLCVCEGKRKRELKQFHICDVPFPSSFVFSFRVLFCCFFVRITFLTNICLNIS